MDQSFTIALYRRSLVYAMLINLAQNLTAASEEVCTIGQQWCKTAYILQRDVTNVSSMQIHTTVSGTSSSRSCVMTLQSMGLDVMEPINPKASKRHVYILATTDYSSKWAEAVTLCGVIKEIFDFARTRINYQHGSPQRIITDNI